MVGEVGAVPVTGSVVIPPPGSALEAAQQHLRELSRQEITDLDTALSRLQDERSRYEIIYTNILKTFSKFLPYKIPYEIVSMPSIKLTLHRLIKQYLI